MKTALLSFLIVVSALLCVAPPYVARNDYGVKKVKILSVDYNIDDSLLVCKARRTAKQDTIVVIIDKVNFEKWQIRTGRKYEFRLEKQQFFKVQPEEIGITLGNDVFLDGHLVFPAEYSVYKAIDLETRN